ncbi:hypothetical protein PCANC_03226 [Puccinia coronata f. sp. avenae]|uniref:Uncharacterized protein n=1 Tax=Puccinia coronata f. sp. avenae TaxID=200324 RepID=A0A2N5VZ29_9BASI|nr:hypothetical protein PCANC_03226 [Puccinia coronata f. sp. avenae]
MAHGTRVPARVWVPAHKLRHFRHPHLRSGYPGASGGYPGASGGYPQVLSGVLKVMSGGGGGLRQHSAAACGPAQDCGGAPQQSLTSDMLDQSQQHTRHLPAGSQAGWRVPVQTTGTRQQNPDDAPGIVLLLQGARSHLAQMPHQAQESRRTPKGPGKGKENEKVQIDALEEEVRRLTKRLKGEGNGGNASNSKNGGAQA